MQNRLGEGIGAAILVIAAFLALGTWQIQRPTWKLYLIAQVESRAHAAPVEATGRAEWGGVNAARDADSRVRIAGTFLNDSETLVQAVTVHGPGFWVMTLLRSPGTGIVLINRGFAPTARRDPAARQAGVSRTTVVTGLLRVTEPGGGLPRATDGGWGALVSAQRSGHCSRARPWQGRTLLRRCACEPDQGSLPIGGLMVLQFRDNHLVYALP